MRVWLAVAVSISSLGALGALGACLISFPTDPIDGDADAGADAGAHEEASASDSGDATTPDRGRYRAAVLADAPLVYLRLGEAAGRTAKNEVKAGAYNYAAQGIVYGSPGALAGDSDTAVTFEGGAGSVQMEPGAEFIGNAPFSIEVWFKSAATNTAQYAFIVDHQTYLPIRHGWALVANNTELRLERWNNGQGDGVTGASPGADGAWHHLVATYDGLTQALYLDAVPFPSQQSQRSLDGPIATAYLVAHQNCSNCGDNPFIGTLDELAIYDKALPIERIRAHRDAAK